jgi:PAS domain S-box-containing protein
MKTTAPEAPKKKSRTLSGVVSPISNAKGANNAAAMFQGLLDTAPDAIVTVNGNDKIVLLNTRAESLFGYKRDELLNRPIEILVPERCRAEYTARRSEFFTEPRAQSVVGSLELIGLRSDGSEFPIEISLTCFKTGRATLVSSTIRDITAQKQAQLALRRSEDQFRLLVNGVKDYAIFMLDQTGRIVSWNTGAERIKGYRAGEILGRHFSKPENPRRNWRALSRTAARRTKVGGSGRMVRGFGPM